MPTINPVYYRASFTATADPDEPRLGVDMMTGQPMYLEDALHPLPIINLDTASEDNPEVIVGGTLATVDIQHAKPNTQVWARGYSFDPISYNPDGTPEYDQYFLPNPQATTYSSVLSPSSGDVFPGGWLVGSTDSNGHFTLDFQAGAPFGDTAIAIYVGNETISPQVGLDGVTRNNYNPSLSSSNYFGSVTFFLTPNPSRETFESYIRRWVEVYEFTFLKPLLEGKSLDDITTEDPFEAKILQCLKDAR